MSPPTAMLLDDLHRQARRAAGAASSVVIRCTPAAPALLRQALRRRAPTAVSRLRARVPALAAMLRADHAILAPIRRHRHRPLLMALGCRNASRAQLDSLWSAVDLFGLALDCTQDIEGIHQRHAVARLVQEVAQPPLTPTTLPSALDTLCLRSAPLFKAARVTVWLHDRRAERLTLIASSEGPAVARGAQVPTADGRSPAARGLRRPPELRPAGNGLGPDEGLLTVPLRGNRRAVGIVVAEGIDLERTSGTLVLEQARDLGFQLGQVIENLALLAEEIRMRRELENAFDSITDLVAVCDRTLFVLRANRSFASRVGLSTTEIVDRPLGTLMDAETAAWIAGLDTTTDPGPVAAPTRQITDRRLGGTYVMSATPLMTPEGQRSGTLIVAREVGVQETLEAERAKLRERLAQSEKLAALGQLVAGIAHELNNPLQGVLGHLELLRATRIVPREMRRDFRTVYREADRAAKIVRNLLVFAGSRRLIRRRLSLSVVISRALALRATTWQELGIETVRRSDEPLPRLLGDPLLLQQALLNIIVNAEQAIASTGGGGRVEITSAVDWKRSVVVVTIRDTGPGIPVEALGRIFEPFFTTKEVGQGTGLGLAITYGIIQEHGGAIHAGNHPEGGAVFTLEFPATSLVLH